MRTILRATLMLLISCLAFAQSRTHGSDRLFARFSYGGGHIVDWRYEQGNPQICFALYRSGYYRVSRLTERGTETLQGTLREDQVTRFRKTLENLDFQSSEGGVIREGAEMLEAEIVRKGKPMHYRWINPDDQRPFPDSVMNLVKWLRGFEPEGAFPFTERELSDQPSICPPASPNPLVPLFASLHPDSGSHCQH